MGKETTAGGIKDLLSFKRRRFKKPSASNDSVVSFEVCRAVKNLLLGLERRGPNFQRHAGLASNPRA